MTAIKTSKTSNFRWVICSLIDTATTKQGLRDKANAYERTIQGSRYKKEYCKYDESDGMHFGYHFTLFDERLF